MQVLTLRVGERVHIGADVTVTIVDVTHQEVTLEVVTPEGTHVLTVPAAVPDGNGNSRAEVVDSSKSLSS